MFLCHIIEIRDAVKRELKKILSKTLQVVVGKYLFYC
jgi:hypothetical protein